MRKKIKISLKDYGKSVAFPTKMLAYYRQFKQDGSFNDKLYNGFVAKRTWNAQCERERQMSVLPNTFRIRHPRYIAVLCASALVALMFTPVAGMRMMWGVWCVAAALMVAGFAYWGLTSDVSSKMKVNEGRYEIEDKRKLKACRMGFVSAFGAVIFSAARKPMESLTTLDTLPDKTRKLVQLNNALADFIKPILIVLIVMQGLIVLAFLVFEIHFHIKAKEIPSYEDTVKLLFRYSCPVLISTLACLVALLMLPKYYM